MRKHTQVPAAERTLRILELVRSSPQGLSAGVIGETLSIPRSALYALLGTLKRMDYLAQEGPRQPYRSGPRMEALSRSAPTGSDLLLRAFHEETRVHAPEETLSLSLLNGEEVVFLAEAPSGQAVRAAVPIGHHEPAREHPAGLVLLADRRNQAGPELSEIAAFLETVRSQASVSAERDDLVMLAVPVCPNGYGAEAALCVHIPRFRWRPEARPRLLGALRETAARISYRLGASTYLPYGAARPHTLGPSTAMPPQELEEFLRGPWTARLACVRPDGSPHVVPIWYEWREGAFLIAAWPGSAWAHFVHRNPAVALTIDEPWPPLRRVLVRGRAHPPTPGALREGVEGLRRRLSARYLGPGDGPAVLPEQDAGWRLFTVQPDDLIARRETLAEGLDRIPYARS